MTEFHSLPSVRGSVTKGFLIARLVNKPSADRTAPIIITTKAINHGDSVLWKPPLLISCPTSGSVPIMVIGSHGKPHSQ